MPQSTYSLSFDGTSGYVEKTSPTGLPAIEDAKWISLWAKHDGVAARRILFTLCKDNTSGANNSIGLELNNDSGLLTLVAAQWGSGAKATAYLGPSDANVPADTWFHVLYTCAAGQTSPKIYINGTDRTFFPSTGSQTGSVGVVRAASFNAAYPDPYHNRSLDHIAVGAGTLNGTQAAGLADGSIDPATLSPALFWKFEEGSGTTTADASGNGNTGTLTGGVTWSSDVPSPLAGGGGTSYSVTMSGGAVLAGSSPTALSATAAGSGGATAGGSVTVVAAYAPSMTGGAVAGSGATIAASYVPAPSGGAVLSGTAVVVDSYPVAMSGGAVLSGSASVAQSGSVVTMSGGVVAGGSAVVTWSASWSASGGAVGSGSAGSLWSATYAPDGTAVLSGFATVSYVPAGGLPVDRIVFPGPVLSRVVFPGHVTGRVVFPGPVLSRIVFGG